MESLLNAACSKFAIFCPDKRKDFETISLSRKTVTSRIEAIDRNILSQLESKIGQFKLCSITTDESWYKWYCKLLLYIRGVDENFCITEELACMRSLKGTTTGSDIFHEFMEGISTLKVPINCICSITTDGARNMTGKNSGFVGILMKNIQITMLHFYIASYIKTPCVNLLWIWNLCLTLLWSWLMLFGLEGLLTDNFGSFYNPCNLSILIYCTTRKVP